MPFGTSTISSAGDAVSSLFAGMADEAKGQGDLMEAKNYDLAASLADKNVEYTKMSTDIKNTQAERQIYQQTGAQQAAIGESGFSSGGSAGDLLRESASQGSLTHSVISQQGLIQEQGYQEQADSYRNMSTAAHMAADAENTAATGADISAGFKAAASIATLFI